MRIARGLLIIGSIAVIVQGIRMILQKVFPAPSKPSVLDIVIQIPDHVEGQPPPCNEPHDFDVVSNIPSCNEPHDFAVFLSFRGKDTRNGFTGHLYQALCNRNLKTFIDSEDLKNGEKIEELFGYIERSKVFVPIISKGYADSKWCLQEIAKIVECAGRRLIVPIFFGVEPSDVRHQTGPFQIAFESYNQKMDKTQVDEWRNALKRVADLKGHHLKNDVNWHEASLVDRVVNDLLRRLDTGLLHVADHPVGLESRIDDMMELLRIHEGNGVKMIGIVGTGGIGKTTIAKAVFNKLRLDFGASTFLSNVRESWETEQGKKELMRQLVGEILEDRVTPIHNIDVVRNLFQKRVPSKKVLVVLDDVYHIDQFRELIGGGDRFISGSRIIITTRDKGVLSQCGVKPAAIYKPMLLDDDQSLYLFKSYAFERNIHHQQEDLYVDLSMQVVAFAGGLPLALKVFGSYLCDKNDPFDWQDYLDMLRETPEDDIQKRLRISYDGLREKEKEIFLDIVCFFRGHSLVEATLIWESLNWKPGSKIKTLQMKSLVTIGDNGYFEVHDLISDMGRDIVRQKSGELARLLITGEDEFETLKKNRRNDDIQRIRLVGTGPERLEAEIFGELTSLKVLQLGNVCFDGKNFMLPGNLKFLCLTLTKFNSLKSCNFENLVVPYIDVADDMSELLVKESTSKVFKALKFLKMYCHSIEVTPDFSSMPHLEALDVSYCASLVEVHKSIGMLTKLKHLTFIQCLNLEKLPDAICQLTSLKTLHLGQFPRLESLPERLGDLESLDTLQLEDMTITSIPSSIGQLTKLRRLYLRRLDRLRSLPDCISSLNSLQVLNIEGTDLKGMKIDGADLMDIGQLEISSCNCVNFLPASSLKKTTALFLKDGTIEELPRSLEVMEGIAQLSLRCKNLKALPVWLPHLKNIKTLEVDCEDLTLISNQIWALTSIESLSLCCANLEELPAATMPKSFTEILKSFTLRCKNLRALPGWIGSLPSLEYLKLEACESITELPSCVHNLSRLEELALRGCRRIRSVPRLPSSILALDASNCSDLEKTLDVSNLNSLKQLRLGGCRLLEEVQGIENTAQNLEELVLPGPYGSMGYSCLSDDFKNKVFKELRFKRLRQFEIWGSLAPGCPTGQQQLAFMFPNGASGIKPELRIERLVLNNVPSPIHLKLVDKDHCVIFESRLEVQPPIVKNFFRPIWIPLPRVSEFRVHYRGRVIFDGLRFIGVPCHENCAMRSRYAIGGSKVVEVEDVASEDGLEDCGGRTDETEADGEPEVLIEVQGLREVTEDGREEDGGRDSTETEAVEVDEEVGAEEGEGHYRETEDEEEVERETQVLDDVEEVAEDGCENGGASDREIEDGHHGAGNEIRVHGPKIIQVFQPNRVPYFLASYPSFIHWQREYSSASTDYEVNFKKEDQIQEYLRTGSHATILVSADTSNLTTVRMTFSFTGED